MGVPTQVPDPGNSSTPSLVVADVVKRVLTPLATAVSVSLGLVIALATVNGLRGGAIIALICILVVGGVVLTCTAADTPHFAPRSTACAC